MIAIQISLNILPVMGLLALAFITGFYLRSKQLKSSRKKIIGLEKEMLRNHADILELQKEKAILIKQMKESKIPVIPMKSSKDDDEARRAK